MRFTFSTALVVFMVTLGCTRTGDRVPFDEGMAAYNRDDYATALREFRLLAKQGRADAQFRLGFMYDKGKGVPEDYVQAYFWYDIAARQGNAGARYSLGIMYFVGRGVSQDSTEAAKWWRKAAEQGYAKAQYNLGVMHAKGEGVPLDYVQAYLWFNLAATQGHADALTVRDDVAGQMTLAQIAKAQKLAREWFAKFGARKTGKP